MYAHAFVSYLIYTVTCLSIYSLWCAIENLAKYVVVTISTLLLVFCQWVKC